jgi:hypothetical protein
MAQGDANKVWIVPSDFGKALEGFTKMLGAPGGDGVFRFEPSPVDDAPNGRPEDDDEAIKDWFDTSSDPEIARVVADAQAQARAEIPPSYAPSTPAVPAAPRPGELPSRTPEELPTGDGRVGLPARANHHAPERPAPGERAADRSSREPEWSDDRPPGEWPVGERQSPGPGVRPTDRPSGPADRPSPARWPRSGGEGGPQAGWSDGGHDGPPTAPQRFTRVSRGRAEPRERRAHPAARRPARRRGFRHRGARQPRPPRLPVPAAVAPQLTHHRAGAVRAEGPSRKAAVPPRDSGQAAAAAARLAALRDSA